MKPRLSRCCVALCSTLALVAGPTGPAGAVLPDNLSDIPYQDTGWGRDQLRSRGYALVSSHRQQDGKTVEYWWQGSGNTCIQARAAGSKYEALKVTPGTDCNQYQQAATANNNAAAIALGAAALIGVAALAHKSHEREEKHDQDSRSVAEFDRGYRDGLHHERYHNYDNTAAYSDGYNAGQRERDQQTAYRSRDGRHSGGQPYVQVGDLMGARASSADGELRSRGFTDVGGYKQGGKSYVTWYNARTHQCIQAVTREGRISGMESIGEGNCR